MRIENDTKASVLGSLAGIVCAVSVLSQVPAFVASGVTSIISILAWLVLAFFGLMANRGKFLLTVQYPLYIVMVLAGFYLVAAAFNNAYLRSGLPYAIVLAMFVLVTGNTVGAQMNRADLNLIFKSYILSSTILAIVVYRDFFAQVTDASPIYVYAEKNSTAQILITAVILIMTTQLDTKEKKRKWLHLGCLVINTAVILMTKSRATIIFFPFLAWLVLTSSSISKKYKRVILFCILIIVIVLMRNREFRDSLLNDIVFAGRDSSDMNSLSSGRWEEWQSFFTDWGDGWLFGYGRMKRESLILTAFLEYGIFFGMLILVLAAYPLYFALRKLPKQRPERTLLVCVASCYLVNGIFEQLAPFGPGVKCFFLWFLLGILASPSKDAQTKSKQSQLR